MSGVVQPIAEFMAEAAVRDRTSYLVDDEAQDVSRITGLPWSYEKVHSKGIRRPFLDLRALSDWDRFRVALALIGGYNYLSRLSYV